MWCVTVDQTEYEIEKLTEKVEKLKLEYSKAKVDFISKLERKYELLETRNEKDKFIFVIDIIGNYHLIHLNLSNQRFIQCICSEENKENCKSFSKEITILIPQIKEAFSKQILAAKNLLHNKRRLQDLKNNYHYDPDDMHYSYFN